MNKESELYEKIRNRRRDIVNTGKWWVGGKQKFLCKETRGKAIVPFLGHQPCVQVVEAYYSYEKGVWSIHFTVTRKYAVMSTPEETWLYTKKGITVNEVILLEDQDSTDTDFGDVQQHRQRIADKYFQSPMLPREKEFIPQ